jgi:hypothetical protein
MVGLYLWAAITQTANIDASKSGSSPGVTYLGHTPLPNSNLASGFGTHRWIYSFKGYWPKVVRETREYCKTRFHWCPGGASSGPVDRQSWRFVGKMHAYGALVIEDSVTLLQNARTNDAGKWLEMRQGRKRDSGWITVILARPAP